MPTTKMVSDILSYFSKDPLEFHFDADSFYFGVFYGGVGEAIDGNDVARFLVEEYGYPRFTENGDDVFESDLTDASEPFSLIPEMIPHILQTIMVHYNYGPGGPFICHNSSGSGSFYGEKVGSIDFSCCLDCHGENEEINFEIKIPKKYDFSEVEFELKIDSPDVYNFWADIHYDEEQSTEVCEFFEDLRDEIADTLGSYEEGFRTPEGIRFIPKVYFEEKFTIDSSDFVEAGDFLIYDLHIPVRVAREQMHEETWEISDWPFEITD